MSSRNACVFGKCKGLYYIDNKFFTTYRRTNEFGDITTAVEGCVSYNEHDQFELDAKTTDFEYDFIKNALAEALVEKYKSFRYVNRLISRSRYVIAENSLFYIVVEDNQRRMAVELIEKDLPDQIGLQMGLYKRYLKGIEEILLDMFGEV